MPRISVAPKGLSDTISLDPSGLFAFPKRVIDRLQWSVPGMVQVDYLLDKEMSEAPLTLFLSSSNDTQQSGFTLSYLNATRDGGSGGKIKLQSMVRLVIAPRVVLPVDNLVPIYPQTELADLVLMLTQPVWTPLEFTLAKLQAIPSDLIGVYQILNESGKPVKIGQGNVANRLREHLKEERYIRAAKTAQFFPVSLKEDAPIFEQVLIAQHEMVYEALPEMHRIRA